jgi:hypothetical protein
VTNDSPPFKLGLQDLIPKRIGHTEDLLALASNVDQFQSGVLLAFPKDQGPYLEQLYGTEDARFRDLGKAILEIRPFDTSYFEIYTYNTDKINRLYKSFSDLIINIEKRDRTWYQHMTQPEGLISVLLDKSARIDERDDAAIDLRKYDEEIALESLLQIAIDPNEELTLMETCGESIAEIWVRNNRFNFDVYNKMHPQAQLEAKGYIKIRKPEWLIHLCGSDEAFRQ